MRFGVPECSRCGFNHYGNCPTAKVGNVEEIMASIARGDKQEIQTTSMLEKMCRIICKAEDVDPDQESVGIGAIMPAGRTYKLWEARKRVAEALIAEGFADV